MSKSSYMFTVHLGPETNNKPEPYRTNLTGKKAERESHYRGQCRCERHTWIWKPASGVQGWFEFDRKTHEQRYVGEVLYCPDCGCLLQREGEVYDLRREVELLSVENHQLREQLAAKEEAAEVSNLLRLDGKSYLVTEVRAG